ncbi:MAG: adenylate/guanylate cyclase domain-containing protein [Alphaproteobacteria bacterium]
MRLTQRISLVTIGVCAAAAVASTAIDPSPSVFDGPLHDLAVVARAEIEDAAPADTPVVVIAVDDRSLEAERLASMPRAIFSPVWAEVIDYSTAAGAKVVAFDFLFSFNGNALSKNWDRPLLQQLFRHREEVVLGRSSTTVPPPHLLAALRNDQAALGLLELIADGDGVYRQVQRAYATQDGQALPGLSRQALARAGVEMPATVRLAPHGNLEARIPTYALIDVLNCAEADPDKLAEALGGKVVFVGSTLPEEDRKFTPDRLFRPLPRSQVPASADGCSLVPQAASLPGSRTRPGVYIHAGAAAAVLTGEVVVASPLTWRLAAAAAGAVVGAAIGLTLAPWLTVIATVAGLLALWAVQVLALGQLTWLPTAGAMVALLLSVVVGYVVRYLLEERRRRRVQNAFGKFLAPSLVEKLTHEQLDLSLGGEDAELSVMFADLSGFTALSTQVSATELVETTNRYLALIADEVDRTDGYVDKFIGDAVMGFWGAPVADAHHAEKAMVAALRIVELVAEEAKKDIAAGHRGYGVKVGVYSGPAIVGNVGSERRFNYTAVGETVNVAARLESLPSIYECPIVVGDRTADAVRGDFLLREIDYIAVKGRSKPLAIFEPIAHDLAATDQQRDDAAAYEAGLAHYRARRFKEAAETWATLPHDAVAHLMADRAQRYMETPPPDDWDGVNVLTSK